MSQNIIKFTTDLRREPKGKSGVHEDPLQETQLVRGEPVIVIDGQPEWSFVSAPWQPVWSGSEWKDYEGWVLSSFIEEGTPLPPLLGESPDPIHLARSYLGQPYLWGGCTKRGLDCSALIHLVWRSLGRKIPRNACDQFKACQPIETPERGDLVFIQRDGKIKHVMLWTDEGSVIEACEDSMNVREMGWELRQASIEGEVLWGRL